MSVKLENRPENRFITLTHIIEFGNIILTEFKPVEESSILYSKIYSKVLNNVIDSISKTRVFNSLDVFTQYKEREMCLIEVLKHVETLRTIMELIMNMEGNKYPKRFKRFFELCEKILVELKHVKESDKERKSLGKEKWQERYNEQKKQEFVSHDVVDNTNITAKDLNKVDRFDVTNLVFMGVKS